jgi:hypothetical protein
MARPPKTFPVVLTAWLVPGGGHWLLGQRTRAIFFFLAVTVTFLFGMYLGDFTNISPERHLAYFFAHLLNGGETLLALLLTRGLAPEEVPRHLGMNTGDVGLLYTAVAALLNFIVMMNAWGIVMDLREGKKKNGDGEEEKDEAGEPDEGAA